jgi:hypothetical protein
MPDQNPAFDKLLSLSVDGPSQDTATMKTPEDSLAALLQALAEGRRSGSLEDAEIIEGELLNLLAARRLFVYWVANGSKEDTKKGALAGVKPTQFLRAWNDSVTRVIQLLRARRDLTQADGGKWDALMDEVYDQLDEG